MGQAELTKINIPEVARKIGFFEMSSSFSLKISSPNKKIEKIIN